jgi:putative transposase
VCVVLDVSRSTYYAWRDSGPSQREQQEAALTPLARPLFWKHHRRYGARRIAEKLADLDEVFSPRRVGKIMIRIFSVAVHFRRWF